MFTDRSGYTLPVHGVNRASRRVRLLRAGTASPGGDVGTFNQLTQAHSFLGTSYVGRQNVISPNAGSPSARSRASRCRSTYFSGGRRIAMRLQQSGGVLRQDPAAPGTSARRRVYATTTSPVTSWAMRYSASSTGGSSTRRQGPRTATSTTWRSVHVLSASLALQRRRRLAICAEIERTRSLTSAKPTRPPTITEVRVEEGSDEMKKLSIALAWPSWHSRRGRRPGRHRDGQRHRRHPVSVVPNVGGEHSPPPASASFRRRLPGRVTGCRSRIRHAQDPKP